MFAIGLGDPGQGDDLGDRTAVFDVTFLVLCDEGSWSLENATRIHESSRDTSSV